MSVSLTPIVSTTGLISVDLATQNAKLSALNTSNPDLLASLIAAASSSIERYCKRKFAMTDYIQYFSGGAYPYTTLQLTNFPAPAVSRLGVVNSVLQVTNTSSSVQRATVAVTATSVVLTRVTSGVSTANTLALSSYATLSGLAAAIIAVGNGWTASVLNAYGGYPSADLRSPQGALSCSATRSPAYLEMYTEQWLCGVNCGDEWFGQSNAWRLEPETGILYGRFPQGNINVRCDYTAGFDEIPEDVQQACVEMVLSAYQEGTRDITLASIKVGDVSRNFIAAGGAGAAGAMSPRVKQLLSSYVDHSKTVLFQ